VNPVDGVLHNIFDSCSVTRDSGVNTMTRLSRSSALHESWQVVRSLSGALV
jgi:hypothetical protein